MPSEFPGMAVTNDRFETRARSGPLVDKDYALRLTPRHALPIVREDVARRDRERGTLASAR
jgi:hypothetical protein